VEGSGLPSRKRRSVIEGSGLPSRKRRSIVEGSGLSIRKRRSIVEGSGLPEKKKRSSDGEDLLNNVASKIEKLDDHKQIRSEIGKGMDKLMSLIMEIYRQQKTIQQFQSSVETLRSKVLQGSDMDEGKRKFVRDEISHIAKDKLHELTRTIDDKIKTFASSHPEVAQRAKLASDLLPDLPLNDDKYQQVKREIVKRSTEEDSLEDVFAASDVTTTTGVPDILREHFKRNSEDDVVTDAPTETSLLTRHQREVADDEFAELVE